ncbi:MAG: potassium channel family protein [Actinomycetales bacterium]|nr:potassium channel family protein [Actinomycetales bacterium]
MASRWRVRRSWLWPSLLAAVVVVLVAAGAAAAIETDSVTSYWRGLWWSISLITTVGFLGAPPRTAAGAALSVVLMVLGFLLLAMVSASLAAFFVSDEERPRDAREQASDEAIIAALSRLEQRLDALEERLGSGEPRDGRAPPDADRWDPLPATEV